MARNLVEGAVSKRWPSTIDPAKFAVHIGTCVQIRREYIKQVENDGRFNPGLVSSKPYYHLSPHSSFSIVVTLMSLYRSLYSIV